MEEHVGLIWDRLVTRAAEQRYPAAAVTLEQVSRTVGVLFRALGGDGGLQVEAANATEHGARRTWLQRLAGSNREVELSWRDEQALRLPAVIECFPEAELNRDLYLWLAALASQDGADDGADWFVHNQRLTRNVLKHFPGMRARFQRLLDAHIRQRPDPGSLPGDQAARETAIRAALQHPGSRERLPEAKRAPQPVVLWLHPAPPVAADGMASGTQDDADAGERQQGASKELEDQRRRAAERTDMPEEDRGLITVRMENIFCWGEFVKVDRGAEENEDLDEAASAAEDMEKFSVTRDGKSVASRLRFDLDLPAASADDQQIGAGILLPEWDYKTQRLQAEHCRVQPMVAAGAEPCELPAPLRQTALRLRAQFQMLAPART